jgi:predicted tellurium resistance membrane protein TerC
VGGHDAAGVLDRRRSDHLDQYLLSGDNAVVIALACRSLPPKQRFWGILLGAGAAVLLRIFFTIIIAQIMGLRSSSWSAACCCSGSRSS